MNAQGHETRPSVYVPWALAGSFGVLCLLLLAMGGTLRDKNTRLAERLSEAEQVTATLRQEQAESRVRARQMQTNQAARVQQLQRQIAQNSQDFQKQKAELETRLEQRANDFAQAQKQIVVLRDRATQDATELQRLNYLVGTSLPSASSLNQLRVGVLNPTADGPPNATAAAIWDPAEQRGLLVAENLAPLPPNLDYQLWIIDPSMRAPISGGTFRVNERGVSRIDFKSAQRLPVAERFAISVERRGGVTSPQGRIIMATN